MESIAPGGSAVFDYRPDAYRAVAGTIVLESDGKPNFERQRRLGKFLADEFLGCFVGRPDTYFDWDMATLGEDLCDRLKETPIKRYQKQESSAPQLLAFAERNALPNVLCKHNCEREYENGDAEPDPSPDILLNGNSHRFTLTAPKITSFVS